MEVNPEDYVYSNSQRRINTKMSFLKLLSSAVSVRKWETQLYIISYPLCILIAVTVTSQLEQYSAPIGIGLVWNIYSISTDFFWLMASAFFRCKCYSKSLPVSRLTGGRLFVVCQLYSRRLSSARTTADSTLPSTQNNYLASKISRPSYIFSCSRSISSLAQNKSETDVKNNTKRADLSRLLTLAKPETLKLVGELYWILVFCYPRKNWLVYEKFLTTATAKVFIIIQLI